jgi:catechol 2,3-dioxygenase-like lactoylglutathione lyase family enzyme
MKISAYAGVGLALAIASAALAQPPAAAPAAAAAAPDRTAPAKPLPANLKPNRIRASGITVADLDKETAFYVNVFGMQVLRRYGTNEVALGYKTGPTEQAALVLLRGNRREGAASYGRLILDVPDADALAVHLRSLGYTARKVGQPTDRAYFVGDPEGNQVEIYTPPAGQ